MSKAEAVQKQGVELFMRKEYEEALPLFQEAHTLFTAENRADMAAEMRVNIGLVYRALGQDQQALDEMTEALRFFEAAADERRSAMVLGNLGRVYAAIGDNEQAYTCFRTAADIFDQLGEKALHSETMLAMGDLQAKERKFGAAASSYEIGLSERDRLTARQKVMKGLIDLRSRLTGGN
jgi:tetratricopeptide (TPR) repeat protein